MTEPTTATMTDLGILEDALIAALAAYNAAARELGEDQLTIKKI